MVTPEAKRTVVRFWREGMGLSERRACSLIGLDRSTHRTSGGLIATVSCDNGCASSPSNAADLAIGACTCCCAEKAMR